MNAVPYACSSLIHSILLFVNGSAIGNTTPLYSIILIICKFCCFLGGFSNIPLYSFPFNVSKYSFNALIYISLNFIVASFVIIGTLSLYSFAINFL